VMSERGVKWQGLVVSGACFALGVGVVQHAFAAVPSVAPVVHAEYPHDTNAFTQGLLFVGEELYESTGLLGSSTLREVELTTGAVKRAIRLPPDVFAEGLADVGERLIQLTWKNGDAYVYDKRTFERTATFAYSGEGWGLCYDGQRLVMSDGSSSLFFRDPTTFSMTGSVAVSRDGQSVSRLNELECVNGWVYANIWQTKEIVKIDPASGEVVARILVDGLLTTSEARAADVLNGIAYQANSGRFYITGKLWPKLFEVEFPGAAAPTPPPTSKGAEAGSGSGSTNGTANGHATSGAPNTLDVAPPKVNGGCRCVVARNPERLSAVAWAVGLAVLLPWVRRRRQPRTDNS
jgi:glutamine cyclotransferase